MCPTESLRKPRVFEVYILWNGSKHLLPQRASAPRVSAGIVFPIGQSSRLAARDKSPPSSFTTWACGAQQVLADRLKPYRVTSPELSFIMSSSCEASSTCPIPSRSSWPPLPHSYSQTPGGTLFSTTPGGETTQCFFFYCRMYFITSDLVLLLASPRYSSVVFVWRELIFCTAQS